MKRTHNIRRKMGEEKAVALAAIAIVTILLATVALLPLWTHATPATTYEYVIVTEASLADEFQVLADWKSQWLNGSQVVTVDDDATDQQIKTVIEYYWANHGTRFVLLGGDEAVIPAHLTWVDGDGGRWLADDFWYANFDEDQENVSAYEVYIGRAPVNTKEDAMHFVWKVITYEQMEKPKANLFHAAWLHVNDTLGRQIAENCMQYVPSDYDNYTLFQEWEDPVTDSEWIELWSNPGIMSYHYGHSHYSPQEYQISYQQYTWTVGEVFGMDNNFWPVHTTYSCMSGKFDSGLCLAEAYVKADSGAIAVFANYDAGTNELLFIEKQFYVLYQEGYQNIGAILAESKHYFIDEANDPQDPYAYRYEIAYRGMNLMGDPETPVLTKRVPTLLANFGFEKREYAPGCGVFKCQNWTTNKPIGTNGGWRELLGDVDGDGDGDVTDLNIVQAAYGSHPGYPNWNPDADVDGDEDVDVGDQRKVENDCGKTSNRTEGAYSWRTNGGDYQMWQWLTSDAIQTIKGHSVMFSFLFYPDSFAVDGSQNNARAEINYEHAGGNSTDYSVWIGPTELKWWRVYVAVKLPDTTTAVRVIIHGTPNFTAWVDHAQILISGLPNIPSLPSGYTSGYRDVSYTYSVNTTDPDGHNVQYEFDWGDGTTFTTPSWYASGAIVNASHSWDTIGAKYVKVRAIDETNASSGWSSSLLVNIVNRPPNIPYPPTGPDSGSEDETLTYWTSAEDPDDDQVWYQFDWNDTNTDTIGPYASGSYKSASHSWSSEGTYYVKVRAKDDYEDWSDWSGEKEVTITSEGGPCHVSNVPTPSLNVSTLLILIALITIMGIARLIRTSGRTQKSLKPSNG